MSWLQRLKSGLTKTSNNLGQGLTKIFTAKKLDQTTLDEFEELLISADLGVELAMELSEKLSKAKFGKDVTDQEITDFLKSEILTILRPIQSQITIADKPTVIIFTGVNGNGKTTTLGKLAAKFKAEGKQVVVAACDTFRAAAEEQLEQWANRAQVKLIQGQANQDPASVAYQAITSNMDSDIIMIDTAGRLHNKANLMDELAKIYKVVEKALPGAPHYSLLVLDATTGNNAIEQMRAFSSKVPIDGLIITKLDGTARGGIAVAIAKNFKKPIYYIGVGEQLDDLGIFDCEAFVNSLLDEK